MFDAFLRNFAMNDHWIEEFEHLAIDAPRIDVDTAAGYRPSLTALTDFVRSGSIKPTS